MKASDSESSSDDADIADINRFSSYSSSISSGRNYFWKELVSCCKCPDACLEFEVVVRLLVGREWSGLGSSAEELNGSGDSKTLLCQISCHNVRFVNRISQIEFHMSDLHCLAMVQKSGMRAVYDV